MPSTPPPADEPVKRKRGRPPLSPSRRKTKPTVPGRPRGRPPGSGKKQQAAQAAAAPATPGTRVSARVAAAGVAKPPAADPTAPVRRGRGRPRKDATASLVGSVPSKTATGTAAKRKAHERENEVLEAASDARIFAAATEGESATPAKRPRGRPKGSGWRQKAAAAAAAREREAKEAEELRKQAKTAWVGTERSIGAEEEEEDDYEEDGDGDEDGDGEEDQEVVGDAEAESE
ncbi:hypothetical protein VTJ83DRAFT_5613 [Remersonia thermophila]|uniref:Uncharacterized protein n=1 Tax=Remersonia thermophila TaxID=72144 RepID=A0ABR4D7E3_9PEZI